MASAGSAKASLRVRCGPRNLPPRAFRRRSPRTARARGPSIRPRRSAPSRIPPPFSLAGEAAVLAQRRRALRPGRDVDECRRSRPSANASITSSTCSASAPDARCGRPRGSPCAMSASADRAVVAVGRAATGTSSHSPPWAGSSSCRRTGWGRARAGCLGAVELDRHVPVPGRRNSSRRDHRAGAKRGCRVTWVGTSTSIVSPARGSLRMVPRRGPGAIAGHPRDRAKQVDQVGDVVGRPCRASARRRHRSRTPGSDASARGPGT